MAKKKLPWEIAAETLQQAREKGIIADEQASPWKGKSFLDVVQNVLKPATQLIQPIRPLQPTQPVAPSVTAEKATTPTAAPVQPSAPAVSTPSAPTTVATAPAQPATLPVVPPGYEHIVPKEPDLTASFLSTAMQIFTGMAETQKQFQTTWEAAQEDYKEALAQFQRANQDIIKQNYAAARDEIQTAYEEAQAKLAAQARLFGGATVLPMETVEKLRQDTTRLEEAYASQMSKLAAEEVAALTSGNLQYVQQLRQEQQDAFNLFQNLAQQKLSIAQTIFEIGKYPEEVAKAEQKEAMDLALKYGVDYNPAVDSLDSVYAKASAVAKDMNEIKLLRAQYDAARLQTAAALKQFEYESKATTPSNIASEIAKGNFNILQAIDKPADLAAVTTHIRDMTKVFSMQPPSADNAMAKIHWTKVVPGLEFTKDEVEALYHDSILVKGEDFDELKQSIQSFATIPGNEATIRKVVKWLDEINEEQGRGGGIFLQLFHKWFLPRAF